jgi:transmembrane sensor
MDKAFQISQLIAKDLYGELTDKEKAVLDQWIKEDKENADLYLKVSDKKQYAENARLLASVDKDRGWSRLEEKEAYSFRKHKLLFTVLKYAAVIAIPLMISISVFHFYIRPDKSFEQHQITEIPPGGSKARLILADGRSVLLEELKEVLIETDGTKIVSDEGLLNYQGQTDPDPESVILYNTIEIPRGGEYRLMLSDGTIIYMNAMSSLRYPTRFSKHERVVELSGEAYFDVAEMSGSPFIVKTRDIHVKVLGTRFNLSSYHDDDWQVLTLVSGQVSVSGMADEGEILLEMNEQLQYHAITNIATRRLVDTSIYTAWVSGYFDFDEETLGDLFRRLERWYEIEVVLRTIRCRKTWFQVSSRGLRILPLS